MKHLIYGVFSKDGKCHYVGQTDSLETRRSAHKNNPTGFWGSLQGPVIKVIYEAKDHDDAALAERRYIADYKWRGEAQFNRGSGGNVAHRGPRKNSQRNPKAQWIYDVMQSLNVDKAGFAAMIGASPRTVDGWLSKRPPSRITQSMIERMVKR